MNSPRTTYIQINWHYTYMVKSCLLLNISLNCMIFVCMCVLMRRTVNKHRASTKKHTKEEKKSYGNCHSMMNVNMVECVSVEPNYEFNNWMKLWFYFTLESLQYALSACVKGFFFLSKFWVCLLSLSIQLTHSH